MAGSKRRWLLEQLGRHDEAREAFAQAIALAKSAPEAAHIRQHLDALSARASGAKAES